MALELYMLGLVAQDMGKSLEFYRRLGLALPEGGEEQPHIEVKMGRDLTFFLDAKSVKSDNPKLTESVGGYRSLLEFYLKSRADVDTKYTELTGFGYQSYRTPFEARSLGMYFAMVNDPDGNTILLSGDLEENETSKGTKHI